MVVVPATLVMLTRLLRRRAYTKNITKQKLAEFNFQEAGLKYGTMGTTCSSTCTSLKLSEALGCFFMVLEGF